MCGFLCVLIRIFSFLSFLSPLWTQSAICWPIPGTAATRWATPGDFSASLSRDWKNDHNGHSVCFNTLYKAQVKWAFSSSQLDRWVVDLFFFFIPFEWTALKQAETHLAVLLQRLSLSLRFVCILPTSLHIRCQAVRSVPTQKCHINCIM